MPRRAPDLALALVIASSAASAPACGEDAARVTLSPVDNPCGRPSGARNVRITAYGAAEKRVSVAPDEGIDIADFPADTEQLSIEVEVGAGEIGAAGKTAPFEFLALDDGATLPIFLAPPNGFCPTVGSMSVPRIAPAVARAGDGVLVVGGRDENGAWTASAEFYDPRTSTFLPVAIPDLFDDPENAAGFAGVSLASLPDGRVAMSGGAFQQIAIFDPATRTFVSSGGIEGRAYHASIALDEDHVLLAGGCPMLAGAECPAAEPRRSSKIYDLANTLDPEPGPTLRISRLGAAVFDIGVGRDGQRNFVIAGGQPPVLAEPTSADAILVGGGMDGYALSNVHAQAAQLDGGGVITAFALDGSVPATGVASVIVPGQANARPITAAFVRDGARLVGLEDGRVLGVGGDPTGDVMLYDPTTDRWQTVTPAGDSPGALVAPTLLRLADGSIFVLGSPIGGAASTSAWIYRPSLVGPAIGSMNVLPLDEGTGVLTPEDPSTVVRTLGPPTWTLVGGDAMARAIVGGPRRASGSITASVRVLAGGMALIGQQTGPGRAIVGELTEGQPARIVRLDGAQRQVLCSGREAPPLLRTDLNTTARLEITGGAARLSVESTVLASCEVDASVRGAWGVAALANSSVTVARVTVTR